MNEAIQRAVQLAKERGFPVISPERNGHYHYQGTDLADPFAAMDPARAREIARRYLERESLWGWYREFARPPWWARAGGWVVTLWLLTRAVRGR